MSDEKFGFLDYTQGKVLVEKKKKKKSKKKRKRKGGLDNGWYTNGTPSGSSGISVGTGGMDGGAGGGVGESLIYEIFAGITPAAFSANMNSVTAYSQNDMGEETGLSTLPAEEQPSEEEVEVNAVDNARQIFQRMKNEPNITRAEILNAFMDDVGVTESTATSYYTRFLKEFGMTSDDIGGGGGEPQGGGGGMGDDDELEQGAPTPYGEPDPLEDDAELEEPDDPKRAGIIRVVDNAHLIYKKQAENGTYEELWIYNIRNNTNDELKIRRDILAGTDIPPKKTKSQDGVQSYTSTTMGNAQMLEIKGLPN